MYRAVRNRRGGKSPIVAFVRDPTIIVDANNGFNTGDWCPGMRTHAMGHADGGSTMHGPPHADNFQIEQPAVIGQLTDLDHALVRVGECVRTIRNGAEAAKRRREFLNSAIRANLCEMPDGQFKQILTDHDRFTMLANVMTADQTLEDANNLLYNALNKTLLQLQLIAVENWHSVFNSSDVRS